MDNVTITQKPNGLKRLVPAEGYLLSHNGKHYSVAVVSDARGWKAVKL